jgi:hypothetical protein
MGCFAVLVGLDVTDGKRMHRVLYGSMDIRIYKAGRAKRVPANVRQDCCRIYAYGVLLPGVRHVSLSRAWT